jgi:hypothetical protein
MPDENSQAKVFACKFFIRYITIKVNFSPKGDKRGEKCHKHKQAALAYGP